MSDGTVIKVAHAGVGPVGCRVIDLILQRSNLKLVGVIDADERKVGQPLEEFVAGANGLDLSIEQNTTECIKRTGAQVLTHTTVSYLPSCIDHLREIARTGIAAVSSTEELLYPWLRHPKWSRELDELCKEHGSRILGTGVNPGFVMDLLPVMCAIPCERVRSVKAERVVDAATRRGPLQRKVGAGITTDEFAKRVAGGRFGHVGYCESGALLAAGMGWSLDSVSESIEPMIADRHIKTDFVEVQPGQVTGIHQTVRGNKGGDELIHLDLKMYVGAPDPHDGFELDSDPPIAWRSENGVAGDPATASIVINSVDRILATTPGVKTVMDLPTSSRNAPQTGTKINAFY